MNDKIDKLYNVLDTILDIVENDEHAAREIIFARVAGVYPELSASFIAFCMKVFDELERIN